MAFTIVLGIVVDDSIHFIMKFREAKNEIPLEDAMGKTFSFVGTAITATTIAFVVDGAAMYATTEFVPHAIIGAFMVLVLFMAWACDLLLMPALLVVYYRRKEKQLETVSFSTKKQQLT